MAERNPSKQKRAAQNKAARQALAARRARAAEPRPAGRPSAVGGEAAPVEEAAAAPRRRFRARPEPTATGRPSRSAPGRPSRVAATKAASGSSAPATSGRPVRQPRIVGPGPDRPEQPGLRGFLAHLQQVPGGKAALFAFIFSLVAAVMVLVTSDSLLREPAEGAQQIVESVLRGKGRAVTPDDSGGFKPILLALVAVPVLVSGVVLEGTRRPNRRRLFTIGALVLGAFVLFVGAVGVYFYFSMGGLFFAAYQARKADPPPRLQRARRGGDEVDDDDLDEDDDDV